MKLRTASASLSSRRTVSACEASRSMIAGEVERLSSACRSRWVGAHDSPRPASMWAFGQVEDDLLSPLQHQTVDLVLNS